MLTTTTICSMFGFPASEWSKRSDIIAIISIKMKSIIAPYAKICFLPKVKS